MDTSRPVEIARSRSKTAALLAGSLLFVAAGVWFFADAEAIAGAGGRPWGLGTAVVRAVGAAAVAFFGFTGVVTARMVLDRSPGLALDARGLTDRTSALGAGFVPWSRVAGVERAEMSGQPFVSVVLHDPEAYVRRAPALRRPVLAANRALGFSPVALTAASLDASVDEVEALVRAYWEAHRLPG